MSKKRKYKFLIFGLILFSLILAFFYNQSTQYKITNPLSKNEEIKKDEKYFFVKNSAIPPKIKAESYLVGDLDSGKIILEKNKENKFPIASVSKLMTALVATENEKPEDLTQVSNKALSTYGENGDLHLGEKIKISDLVYPLLLESSNDAAEVIAESLTRNTFLEKMNEKAKDLGLLATSFEDPSGLSPNNKSTALDLFNLAKYLNTNHKDLLQLTTLKSYNNTKHSWFNNSQFLNLEGYLGGKRGYTDEALQTAVSIFSIPLGGPNPQNIGIALLHSPDRLKDMQTIVSYLRKNIFYGTKEEADIAWIKQSENFAEEKEPDFVNLAFGGDIMLDRGVRNSVMKNFNGDYSMMFQNLDIIKKADIAFGNLEGPASDVGQDKKNLYSFRMSPSVIPALKGAGFSVLSVGNNHEADWGRDAYTDTLARLKENEIAYTGGGINSYEAETPVIIEKYGMKIGYLGFTDVGPVYMKAIENQAGVLLASNPRFSEIIKNASTQVDYLIVSFHFGEEYKKIHNARQEYLAHTAIDNGAKIIIGHHPHVSQDTEVYSPKDCTQSSCMGFIAYSLGNLIFDQYFSEETMQGLLLQIKLKKDGSISVTKNTVKLSKAFQPETIIKGKEEKIIFKKS